MNKKKFVKALVLFLFIIIVIAVISFGAFLIDINDTELQGIEYSTLEDLHRDYINNKESKIKLTGEIVYQLQVEDKIFVFSKQLNSFDSENSRELYIYVVKIVDGKYVLETPKGGLGKYGFLTLEQTDDLKNITEYNRLRRIKINDEFHSICFFYKNIEETRKIYYDEIETNEIEMINPFNDTKYILCYAISFPDKVISFKNNHNAMLL